MDQNCRSRSCICAILVQGITRNISVKLFELGPVFKEMSFEVLFFDLVAILLD